MCSPASSRSVTTQDCINDLTFAMLMELRWRVCFLGAEIDKIAMINLSFNHDEMCMNTFEYDYNSIEPHKMQNILILSITKVYFEMKYRVISK